MYSFLLITNFISLECLVNMSWLQKLYYLAENFTGHNELNLMSRKEHINIHQQQK